MLIKIRRPHECGEHQITPEAVYVNRRLLLQGAGLAAGMSAMPVQAGLLDFLIPGREPASKEPAARQTLAFAKAEPESSLIITPESKATTHNNFYEFGTGKTDPARHSQSLRIKPWTLRVEGEVNKPATVDVWEMMQDSALVERIYRMRCVEAWSMVIPWVGLELGKFLRRFEPTGKAKYVAFETLYDPEQMPGQKSRTTGGGIEYPYVEGLRLDEAMHPLTLLTVGMYGQTLPPQNGAPVRLVVPWKYGFKGIKSIVRIRLMENMPPTSWNRLAPQEYGFYANVNPAVDHPRWSQATERFIGPGGVLDVTRQPTLPFNGYADQVASLYSGMDLKRQY